MVGAVPEGWTALDNPDVRETPGNPWTPLQPCGCASKLQRAVWSSTRLGDPRTCRWRSPQHGGRSRRQTIEEPNRRSLAVNRDWPAGVGEHLRADDAHWLVARLYLDAHGDGVETALWIEKTVERDLYAVALSAGLGAVLRVMVDPPDGLLELRGALLRDHRPQRLVM